MFSREISVTEEAELYPDSAISSWSGFVYQGKVALYHCLKLIHEGDDDFELQLDSTDDFVIYKNDVLFSAHQVKAKIGKYRSSYNKALEKSALIELDRIKGSNRYFHISCQITDDSDYIGSNGEVVKFYKYGTDKYCRLGDIEELTKSVITLICEARSIVLSPRLLDANYCLLSEKISSKAIELHNRIQTDGDSERKAAYLNRIHMKSILSDLLNTNPYNDTEYYAIDLKSRLYSSIEERLDKQLSGMADCVYERSRQLFTYIQKADIGELKTLCQLMKPSERFSRIQKMDIRRYSGLMESINVEPIFNRIPHYHDRENKFYLPTALEIEDHDECTSDICHEMKNNEDLLQLLFEYNNLIPFRGEKSFMINTKYTVSADLNKQEIRDSIDSNIIKSLCISIITKEDAEIRLNDHETY